MSAKVLKILQTIVDYPSVIQTLEAIRAQYESRSEDEIRLKIDGARDTYNPPKLVKNNGCYTFSYDDMDKNSCESWMERFMTTYTTIDNERLRKLKEEALKLQVAGIVSKLKNRKFSSVVKTENGHTIIEAVRN